MGLSKPKIGKSIKHSNILMIKMKKGLLTFHFADNYGALLQTYATVSFLQKEGHNVEIINYVPSNNTPNKHNWSLRSTLGVFFRIMVWPARQKRRLHLERFRKSLPLSPKYSDKNKIDYSRYDVVITGSDQTFNLSYGFTDVYYLEGVKMNAKMAFAASFGSYDYSKLPQPFVEALKNFDSLSFRESQPVQFLKDKYGISASHVLDPVFLLDKNEWLPLIQNPAEVEFVFVYDLNGRDFLIKMALDDKKKSKVIVFSNDPLWRFKSKYRSQVTFVDDLSVELFLGFINNASCVYTDSFHGFAFSIIFEKKVTVFIALPQASERLFSLLSMIRQPVSQSISRYDVDTINHKDTLDNAIRESKSFLLASITAQQSTKYNEK